MDDFKDSVTSVCLGKDANEILAASVDGFIRRYHAALSSIVQHKTLSHSLQENIFQKQ